MSVNKQKNYRDDPLKGYNQQLNDKKAIGMTKAVQRQRQMLLKRSSWIPKPLTDQNSIFAMQSSIRPNTTKNSRYTKDSNIFGLGSIFKPSVKASRFSNRSSNIFTQNQSEKGWKSSSKKVDSYNHHCTEQLKEGKINQSTKMNKSNIFNLQGDFLNQKSFISIKRIQLVDSRNPIIEGEMGKIFQSKKRVVRA